MDKRQFKDHFSGHAADYSLYRPCWPQALFEWLASQSPGRDLAWDCGTGNGQAAAGLARFFNRVLATDASEEQIRHAASTPGVTYRVEAAEYSSLEDSSVDLAVAAQAWHWFDHEAVHCELDRVLSPSGVLAVASYMLITIDPAVDAVIGRLYKDILNGWWAPERAIVDTGLHGIKMPFAEFASPRFEISADWTKEDLLNYLGTWSAIRKYTGAQGINPLSMVDKELAAAWGEPGRRKNVIWPVALRSCRKI